MTGISTGALTAPVASLGPEYDPVLREVYTQSSTQDLTEPRGPLEIVRGDGVTSTRPLLRKIAAEGRSLLVGTTNLDAGRPMVWDITRMAASDGPQGAGDDARPDPDLRRHPRRLPARWGHSLRGEPLRRRRGDGRRGRPR